ncbi:unnamed protein product [Larinioides sclopetarius]|uniref:Uncharacterized protein n=1 Tax=Larinioides sclopetarius TaxID=280406 RepID=A0AAV2B4N3_9ARAC
MSAVPKDFKITPPKVKPQRGTGLVLLVLRTLVCILGPSIIPLTVYFLEGCTNLFFWTLGFGSVISAILLTFDHGNVKDLMQYLKISCCEVICRRKRLHLPFHYTNLSPIKQSSAAKNSCPLRSQTLDEVDLPQSTTAPTIIEIPVDRPSSSSSSGELNRKVSQKFPNLTPTKRRMISAALLSLSPLKNRMDASAKRSPFSKRRLKFPGFVSPRHLKNVPHLSTIFESPYAGNLQPRRLSCFSS